MRRHLVPFLAAAIVTSYMLAGCTVHRAAPPLSTSVTLDAKAQPLSQVFRQIESQTGIGLSASPEIADRKVTIFVDKQSVEAVMKGLTTLFPHTNWQPEREDSGVQELVLDVRARNLELAKARRKAWEEVKADLARRLKPSRKHKRQLDSLDRDCLDLYRTMSQRARDAIWGGDQVCFDTRAKDKEWRIPEPVVRSIGSVGHMPGRSWGTGPDVGNPRSVAAKLYKEDSPSRISVSVDITVRWPPDRVYSQTVEIAERYIRLMPPPPRDSLPQVAAGKALERKVSFDRPDGAELAAAIHKQTGVQVITGAHIVCDRVGREKNTPLSRILEFYGGRWAGIHAFDWGWDGRFLYLRAPGGDLAYQPELPERDMPGIQASFAKTEALDLDHFARLWSVPEPDLDELFKRLGVRLREYDALHFAPEYRLYAELSPAQRKEAFGAGVKVSEFSPAARRALSEVVVDQRFTGPPVVGIYRDGRRIHAPGQSPAPVVVRVRTLPTGDGYYFDWNPGGGMGETVFVKAKSFEDAWRQVERYEGASKGALFRTRWRAYLMTVGYSDGSLRELRINIAVTQSYADVERAGK